jgi:hypothetical protein
LETFGIAAFAFSKMLASLSFPVFQNVCIAAFGFSKTLASLSIAAFQNISIAAFFQHRSPV